MILNYKFCLLFLLFLSGKISAQKESVRVSGYVTDRETGEKIYSATVQAKDITVLSNDYGHYNINISKGNGFLKASFIGKRNTMKNMESAGIR
jgi:hypothetical protein